MIDIELIASLPDDPKEAFLIYENALKDELERDRNDNDWNAESEYMASVNAVAHYYGFEDIVTATDSYLNDIEGDYADQFYTNALSAIARFRTRARFAAAMSLKDRRKRFPIDPQTRQKIHSYVAHIREELTKIDMPESKREAIFAALNRFEMEIDTNRTSFDSVAEVAIKLADLASYWRDSVNPVQGVWEKALRLIEAMRQKNVQQIASIDRQARIEDRSGDEGDEGDGGDGGDGDNR